MKTEKEIDRKLRELMGERIKTTRRVEAGRAPTLTAKIAILKWVLEE